jgi:hypothetical protein
LFQEIDEFHWQGISIRVKIPAHSLLVPKVILSVSVRATFFKLSFSIFYFHCQAFYFYFLWLGGGERLLRRSSTALWRGVFRRELLRLYSDFRRDRNFPESKLSSVCSGGIRNKQNTSGNFFFSPAVFYSRRALSGCSFSAGNPTPRGNPELKRIRMDAILKKNRV